MDNKKWINIFLGYSAIYTITTLLNSVLYLINGIYEDPNGNWHELDRAIIVLIGMMAYILCTKLTVKPLILRYIIAYVPSQLLAFVYIWFSGLREELAETAYKDIWICFTSMFIILSIVNTIINICKEKKLKPFKNA